MPHPYIAAFRRAEAFASFGRRALPTTRDDFRGNDRALMRSRRFRREAQRVALLASVADTYAGEGLGR